MSISFKKTSLEGFLLVESYVLNLEQMLINLKKSEWSQGLRLKKFNEMSASNEERLKVFFFFYCYFIFIIV
jgi:hypothetical protein